MTTRLTALAHLADEFRHLTISMTEVLFDARRGRARFYEDGF